MTLTLLFVVVTRWLDLAYAASYSLYTAPTTLTVFGCQDQDLILTICAFLGGCRTSEALDARVH